MAQNYTRQSSFADGDTITASLFNNEYNQLVNAFTYSSTDVDATGHRHDGTSGEGGNIYRIGDLNFLNKIEADSVNNRWGFFVEVSSTAVEQIRIQDGVILPVITNDIDLGSATFQFKDLYLDGTANIDSLVLSSGSTVTAILDEDSLVSDSSTALATQQSIKAYVDAQVTAQDLDFQGDTGGALSIDLDSETLTIAGGTGIDTVGATNTLTVSIDSTVATLTGTQTLTNKTIDADNNTVSNLEVDNLKSGVLDTDISSVAGTHTTLPSALAVKTYVDAQVTAQDLDIFGDTGTDAIDLDSETLTFTGGTGITSVVTAGTVTHNIDSTVATLTGTQTLTNKTLTSPDINGGTVDGAVIGGTTAAAGSFTNITVSGTVDGRDVAADGTKLDGIEALADVTDTTNVTAAGALMDSELTNITAVKALNQGVATTDSPSFAGLTATTADINAGTIDGTVIGGSTAAAITGTTITGTSFVSSGDMTFGDSDKAIFGAGSDLQIFHDGSNSYVQDAGDGALILNTTNGGGVYVYSAGETMATFNSNGAVNLYHDNSAKLATTATGIDVTGTVTADGLDVDTGDAGNGLNYGFDVKNTASGSATSYAMPAISWSNGGLRWASVHGERNPAGGFGGSFVVNTMNSAGSAVKRLGIDLNGDISFYEDTGTTAKFFWDASAESLGIGTSSPSAPLHVFKSGGSTTSINVALTLDYESPTASLAGSGTAILFKGKSGGGNLAQYDQAMISTNNIGSNNSHGLSFFYKPNAATALTEGLTLDEEGNVGIGVTPLTKLHVLSGTDNNIAAGVSEVRFIGADKAITGEQANLVIQTNDDMAVNKGGSIGLGGRHTTSSTNGVNFAQISGRKENATSANFAGYLAFGTSDSASDIHERMRIDSSGNVGIGLSGAIPSARLQVRTGTNLNLAVQTGTTDTSGMKINAFNDAANTNIPLEINGSVLLLKTGETERARIDSSGNVGIGTSSPSDKLTIKAASAHLRLQGTSNTNKNVSINYNESGDYGQINCDESGVNQKDLWMTGLNLKFGRSTGSESMRIDDLGNVGIGVVPSSWASNTFDALQLGVGIGVGNLTARVDGINAVGLGLNWYYGGGATNTYVASSYATNYVQEAGTHKWLHAASGTAGAALTFTESMRIDSSGNVGIGTSSPSRKVSLVDSVNGYNLELQQTSAYNSGNQSGIVFSAPYNIGGSVTDLASIRGGKENATDEDFGGKLAFYTRANGGSDTERMRIDSSGNLGLGVTPSAWSAPAFQISRGSHFADTGSVGMQHNAYFNSGWKYIASSQGALQFQAIPGTGFLWNTAPSGTAGNAISFSEAMRIDSSGNLLVGRSSAGAAATDNGHVFYGSGQHYIFSNATECVRFYETSGSGQQVGSISITSSATAFNTSSDERLKENITDAPAGNVDDIKVRSFDWKADGSHQDYGMVAQELEAVAPYAVTKGETEDDMWSVDYSKLVPMLIKEIQDLKAEVAALKGAN
jgi:hypothetical protein